MKSPDYLGYESAKRIWIANNPNATPAEYQRAITAIAARYGV